MHFGATLAGRLLTSSDKWTITDADAGRQFKLTIGAKAYQFDAARLHAAKIAPGTMWATCQFVVAASSGNDIQTYKVDGIPNADAHQMEAVLYTLVDKRLVSIVAASAADLDAWVNRAIAMLDAAYRPNGDQPDIGRLLVTANAPQAPATLTWRSVFSHPRIETARGKAQRWPSFVRSPEWTLASRMWHRTARTIVQQVGWIPKGVLSEVTAAAPCIVSPELADAERTAGQRLVKELLDATQKHNDDYLAHQKNVCREFFHTVEKNPLTAEQIHACVCMDDHVMVVAAAGSGKTSTMVAKAGYVLHERLAQPGQILLLAFNHDAALELGRRIAEQLGSVPGIAEVRSRTFHAFGLDVIGAATGKKPSLAPWVETGQDLEKMTEIITALASADPAFKRQWDLFRSVYAHDIGRPGDKPVPDAYDGGTRGMRTARNEIVKSHEERLIADWLFYNGVEYEYERPYEHDTADEAHRQYHPDFYYPTIHLYHEHFAFDANGNTPNWFEGDYAAQATWKRELHTHFETELFETTSHGLRTGRDLWRLEQELVSRGVQLEFDPDRKPVGQMPVNQRDLVRTFRVFQQHVKSNALTHDQLQAALATQAEDGFRERLTIFLALYERIAAEWEDQLHAGSYIDFDDMMIQAAEHIRSGRYTSPYTIILADEFQDSSRARIRLLQALAAAAPSRPHLCVVGDDWQGINRFAGSDISVMNEFERTFEPATRLALTTTFRCPQSLCDVSSRFIQANPAQIRKIVTTTNQHQGQAVLSRGFETLDDLGEFVGQQLGELRRQVLAGAIRSSADKRTTVLLLGRYRDDRPAELAAWQRRYKDSLKIEFRTVHGSKGLEAEYVFVLNVVAGRRGFPSQIQDDPALQMAMPAPEAFQFAEERRLFYVAMTRARCEVQFLTLDARPSVFLTELAKDGGVPIASTAGGPLEPCPKCGRGILKLRDGRFGTFWSCSRFPSCDYTRNAREDAQRQPTKPNRHRLAAGSVTPGDLCPICRSGHIQKRVGQYGPFLGCSSYPRCRVTAPLR
jgi:DNA helicase-4